MRIRIPNTDLLSDWGWGLPCGVSRCSRTCWPCRWGTRLTWWRRRSSTSRSRTRTTSRPSSLTSTQVRTDRQTDRQTDRERETERENEGFSVMDPECLFIPDPNVFHLGSRFRILPIPDPGFAWKKINLSILTQKLVSKPSEIWSGLIIPDSDPVFLPIPDPGFRGQKGTGSRIRIRNSGKRDYKWDSVISISSFKWFLSVVYPHLFQWEFGSSVLPQCGSGSSAPN